MNVPPDSFVTVGADELRGFVAATARCVGLPAARADLLAELLVANDLCGVFSHGSRQIATYARLMRDGRLNPSPEPAVVRETSTSVLVDGDGGLGYFPAHQGTQLVIDKALESGIAIMLTRNHGHVGAAGLYARMTLAHDLLSFVTSGHQLDLVPGSPVFDAAGGSPMSFSAPTATEDPLLLDFGAMHDLYADAPLRDLLAEQAPGLVLRAIGLGTVCQSWGGLLAGVPIDPARATRTFAGANQGSMVITFRIDLFADPQQFKSEMDAYVRAVRALTPMPGQTASLLPGGPEAERERRWSRDGIPVGVESQQLLAELADELGVSVPWAA